jgi:serine phosphatase RsbU (regulator of sigma subunit)
MDHESLTLRYSGAHIPLFYVEDGQITEIKGNKHSIGYKDSDENYPFTLHTIKLQQGFCVYLKTDGFTDQFGGETRRRFGTPRFKQMLTDIHSSSFLVQRDEILNRLTEYKNDNSQMDDITVIGFRV